MTILEKLREEKRQGTDRLKNVEVTSILDAYDLALDNTLLKLGNRGVQIADLKARLKELKSKLAKTEMDLASHVQAQ